MHFFFYFPLLPFIPRSDASIMVATIDESSQAVGSGVQPMMMPSFGYPFMPFPSVPPPPMWQPLPIVVWSNLVLYELALDCWT